MVLFVFLIIATINPFTEEYMSVNPIPYMLAHYSLFSAGIIFSYYLYKSKQINASLSLIIGIIIAFIWHYPYFFNLGVKILWIRAIEEISLLFGGFMVGLSLREISRNIKVLLLALWMIGDTLLSSILMINPAFYTTIYNQQELKYLGIIMFLMMNLIAVYILLSYVNKMLSEEKDVINEDYQRKAYTQN